MSDKKKLQASAGPDYGDRPIDRFIASVPLPVFTPPAMNAASPTDKPCDCMGQCPTCRANWDQGSATSGEVCNHKEAYELACVKRGESNLARCYLALAAKAEQSNSAGSARQGGITKQLLEKFEELAAPVAERAAAPASVPEADADELHFNAQRLRNVAELVGLASAVPQDDATLDGARGAVLGQIAAKLRKSAAPEGERAARDEEVLALHRQLASEKLRADQGWSRYEEANADRNALRERLATSAPTAGDPSATVPSKQLFEHLDDVELSGKAGQFAMTCHKCGVDRSADECPNLSNCGMGGTAHIKATQGGSDQTH